MSTTESVSIQPIDKTTVNQICSGQVVLNLATAVKELLENSIDANADSIQIKLEEYGSDSIEVIDNGCGVEEVNFQALTLKHHTSKITEFSDLYSVETFGFRGEALSSLCALSDVTIITQHKNSDIGATLKFDHNGIITSNVKTLRKTGTTVKLENLFSTLPIRRTEFLKNLKREYSKMCNVLYAYGLQSKGVRITCTNHVLKSKHASKEFQGENNKRSTNSTIMDTRGDSLESNIISVFGIKQKQNLLKITEKLPSQETLDEYNLEKKYLDLQKFKLEGYISSCAHGCGRASSDRQFYFINSRPVDNPKICKLVNDIYHQYNNRQDPFVVLNVKVESGSFDMNVTPDKRQIFLQNEKLLFATLKESLHAVFRNIPSTMEVRNVGLTQGLPTKETTGLHEKLEKYKAKFGCSTRNSSTLIEDKKKLKPGTGALFKFRKNPNIDSQVNLSKKVPTRIVTMDNFTSRIKPPVPSPAQENEVPVTVISVCELRGSVKPEYDILPNEERITEAPAAAAAAAAAISTEDRPLEIPNAEESYNEPVVAENSSETEVVNSQQSESRRTLKKELAENDFKLNEPKRMKFDEGLAEKEKSKRKVVHCNVTLSDIKKLGLKVLESSLREREPPDVRFLADIKPQNNERAENELKKELKQDSFTQMEIIGQFNLGFIITKLAFDLFIIDQHASDEKYNYETLQETTVMQTQKLINPEKLQLTVDKEELMQQHRDVFRRNGFDFVFDNEAPTSERIRLTTIPMSKNFVFGKEDVDELLFLLEDALETRSIRPSRVNSMFASRACRKSVMIGTPLKYQEMRRIVDHMGQMQQPWNCPHGRPTIRHLVNLKMIHLEE